MAGAWDLGHTAEPGCHKLTMCLKKAYMVVLLPLCYCLDWDMVVWPRAAVLGLTCCRQDSGGGEV